MSAIYDKAKLFFDACDSGKGWQVCKEYCHPDATFSAQGPALAAVSTLEGYTDWMKGFFTPVPDGRYELKFFAEDQERQCVAGYGVYYGTHTGPGGPVEPTGKTLSADYAYVMQFEDGRIRHMTKIWNDAFGLRQLGWA